MKPMNTPTSAAGALPCPHPAAPADLLSGCVHCGLCLEVCPTYQLTGDENNSPRGRLRLWREEAEGRLPPDPWTDFYTAECVGCLACETACPGNVPYGLFLEQARHGQVAAGRSRPPAFLRWAAAVAARPAVMQWAFWPARALRRWGVLRQKFVFPGRPAVATSTAVYARDLVRERRPTGPRVALLTGCLMESLFREINFATVRVLVENNVQVVVPPTQGCCGAVQEHLGLDGVEALRERNRRAFTDLGIDAIVTNSSGCGLALQKTMQGVEQRSAPVRDVLGFLGDMGPVKRRRRPNAARVYVDLPCHLVHGQKAAGIPAAVLDATGYDWELAPQAADCCGSGGVYNLQKPENARAILARKSSFLETAAGDPVILATSNHVCMMQWHSAGAAGLVTRPYRVAHVISLLDPEGEHLGG
jgi:glycolate oxidase iron-sulfur subunit